MDDLGVVGASIVDPMLCPGIQRSLVSSVKCQKVFDEAIWLESTSGANSSQALGSTWPIATEASMRRSAAE